MAFTKAELQSLRHVIRTQIVVAQEEADYIRHNARFYYEKSVKPGDGSKTKAFIQLNLLRNEYRKAKAKVNRLRKLSIAIKDELKLHDGR